MDLQQQEFIVDKDTYYIYDDKPINDEMIEEMKNYKKIFFGSNYNQPIDNLPNTITHLIFGYNFNQSLDNLPSSIRSIYFDVNNKFIHPIDKLPEGLVELDLSSCINFNNPVNKLPTSLEILKLGCEFKPLKI
jgi:hypothetical protein